MEITTVEKNTTTDFSITEFVGDSKRASKLYEFSALYERELSTSSREKYGIPIEVNGVIYLSPLQLIPQLGTFKIDQFKTKVHFTGSTQVIQKVEYLEPLYDSCIGVQLFIKDVLKGG